MRNDELGGGVGVEIREDGELVPDRRAVGGVGRVVVGVKAVEGGEPGMGLEVGEGVEDKAELAEVGVLVCGQLRHGRRGEGAQQRLGRRGLCGGAHGGAHAAVHEAAIEATLLSPSAASARPFSSVFAGLSARRGANWSRSIRGITRFVRQTLSLLQTQLPCT